MLIIVIRFKLRPTNRTRAAILHPLKRTLLVKRVSAYQGDEFLVGIIRFENGFQADKALLLGVFDGISGRLFGD